jgi:hypothetical protein
LPFDSLKFRVLWLQKYPSSRGPFGAYLGNLRIGGSETSNPEDNKEQQFYGDAKYPVLRLLATPEKLK